MPPLPSVERLYFKPHLSQPAALPEATHIKAEEEESQENFPGAVCLSCTHLPLQQLLPAVFSFFFQEEAGAGRSDRDQQLAYPLVDADPVGVLMLDITDKRKGRRICFACLEMKKGQTVGCPVLSAGLSLHE